MAAFLAFLAQSEKNAFLLNLQELFSSHKEITKLGDFVEESNIFQEFRVMLNVSFFSATYKADPTTSIPSSAFLVKVYENRHSLFSYHKQISIQLENYGTLNNLEEYLLNKLSRKVLLKALNHS